MEKRHHIRYFTIADYEQEEMWLNAMSRGGWHLTNVTGIFYTFEKGEAGEYVYKLDLPKEQMTDGEVTEYYKFLEECGIEVVCNFKSWRYLRKKSNTGEFTLADNTLTKLAMLNKAYGMAGRILNILIITFATIALAASISLTFVSGDIAQFMEGFITGISVSSLIGLAVIFVPITRRLRLRMSRLVDELQIKS